MTTGPVELVDVPDDLDAFNRDAIRRGWGDGFPLIPPTRERVVRCCAGMPWRDPGEVIGLVPPRWAEATVERIAVNAVMAGSLPEHLPVLVTAVEAACAPDFNLFGLQATTHSAGLMVMVNGPVADQIGIHAGAGLFGPGTHANVAIGRAMRLVLQNIGGAHPGTTDRSTQGSPAKFSFCFAENELASPWEPCHRGIGFADGTSAVTVAAAEAPHNVNDHVSTDPQGVLGTIASTMATLGNNNAYSRTGDFFVGLGPEHAQIVADAGWSRRDVQEFLWEHARTRYRHWKQGGMFGMLPQPDYLDAAEDDLLVPLGDSPDAIRVIVVGGPGKHSCWIPTLGIGASETRQVSTGDDGARESS